MKTVQNLWDTTNAVFREKFTATQACLKKKGQSQISNLTLKVKELEKTQSPMLADEGT